MTTLSEMLIDGEWVGAVTGSTLETFNPSTAQLLGAVPAGDVDDVDRAVQAARRSFKGGVWSGLKPAERQSILWRIGDLIDANAEEIVDVEVRDNGMPQSIAMGMVRSGAEMFRYYAGWCTKIHGKTTDCSVPGDFHAYSLKEPIGVAGLITPWNVPFVMACSKASVALAAGCSIVMKPAEETPLSALRLGQLAVEAGVPAGVLNIVTGDGETAGAALAAHPDVDKIGFTGSTEVGRKIINAASGNLKKVSLELGGKSPVLVFEEADIAAAAQGAALGVFFNSGQACIAGARIFVDRKIYDHFLETMAATAAHYKVGDGFAEDSVLGPLISQKQLERALNLVNSGATDGAEIVVGGKQVGETGYFMEPTVMTAPKPGARILKEEIFGPVANVIPFDDEEEAVTEANNTEYGLAAGIWTKDLSRAHRVAKRIKAGTIWINTALTSDLSLPFGGYGQSGWDRERGYEGLEPYLETKAVYAAI